MSKVKILVTTVALAAITIGTVAIAQGQTERDAVDARKAHMKLYSSNLGMLGDMARGKIDYDSSAAAKAANDLAALAALDQSAFWIVGTTQGEISGSRAKAEIWSDPSGFQEKIDEHAANTAAFALVAGDGLEALKESIRAGGAGCGSCHEVYRGPRS